MRKGIPEPPSPWESKSTPGTAVPLGIKIYTRKYRPLGNQNLHQKPPSLWEEISYQRKDQNLAHYTVTSALIHPPLFIRSLYIQLLKRRDLPPPHRREHHPRPQPLSRLQPYLNPDRINTLPQLPASESQMPGLQDEDIRALLRRRVLRRRSIPILRRILRLRRVGNIIT